MVQAYQGLDELPKAVRAKQIVTAAEKNPTSNQFQQLAALAYQAGENRVGDLAATRAIDLAEPSERKALRTALQTFKPQVAAQQSAQQQTSHRTDWLGWPAGFVPSPCSSTGRAADS